jgi:hypothetical protein
VGLLDDGAAALIDRKQVSDGRSVTYSRGLKAITLTAWLGNTLFARNTDEPGASVVWGERDYVFAVSELVIDGQQVMPLKDDRIAEVIDGQEVTFEVSTPTGEPPARYLDLTRTMWLVHTKRKRAL